ncbi:MAG: hypothetical protein JXK07_17010 [Spirochaetes bacterium]|nr:hypothetical protein [Spirochaetota bacterium]MBN2769241.1 hypothetical protein [Spirochaetota bacterium]
MYSFNVQRRKSFFLPPAFVYRKKSFEYGIDLAHIRIDDGTESVEKKLFNLESIKYLITLLTKAPSKIQKWLNSKRYGC